MISIATKKCNYLVRINVYLFDNLININKTTRMFLRLIIFIFAINTLIPSAMAVNGFASDEKMQMTVSEQVSMSGMSMSDRHGNRMHCASSNTDCKMMMDMDHCDSAQCSTSGYLNATLVSVIFYPNTMSQPPFFLSHFYHIVHPVRTPPPLI